MSAAHKYENVRVSASDEHDHLDHSSRSSTEVESLMGEEKSWKTQQMERKSKRTTLCTILKQSKWILNTTLLLIIVALLVRNELREPQPDQWQLLGDMTGVGPRCMAALFLSFLVYLGGHASEWITQLTVVCCT